MKKTPHTIDIRTIGLMPQEWHFEASDSEKKELADRFDLPEIISLTADFTLQKEDLICMRGTLSADVVQTCVVTMENFKNHMAADFTLYFTNKPDEMRFEDLSLDFEEKDIELLKSGFLNYFDVIAEQFGLNLDPFPKKVKRYGDYIEDVTEADKPHPFAELKKLLKK